MIPNEHPRKPPSGPAFLSLLVSRALAGAVSSSQTNSPSSTTIPKETTNLGESRWAGGGEDLLLADLGDTVGQRESEVLGEELLDVRALDIIGLLELNNAENLDSLLATCRLCRSQRAKLARVWIGLRKRTWIDLKRARWRAAKSWYMASTASQRDISRYSLYML